MRCDIDTWIYDTNSFKGSVHNPYPSYELEATYLKGNDRRKKMRVTHSATLGCDYKA